MLLEYDFNLDTGLQILRTTHLNKPSVQEV